MTRCSFPKITCAGCHGTGGKGGGIGPRLVGLDITAAQAKARSTMAAA